MAALAYNPLVVIGLGILFGWSACRVFEKWSGKSIFGRFLKMVAKIFGARFENVKFTMQQRLRWLVVGAIILNWIYLVVAAL